MPAHFVGASSGAFSANVFTHASPFNCSIMSQSVQCFGKKKNAVRLTSFAFFLCIVLSFARASLTLLQVAVSHCKKGKGIIKVNGRPLSLVEVYSRPRGAGSSSL